MKKTNNHKKEGQKKDLSNIIHFFFFDNLDSRTDLDHSCTLDRS